MKFELTISGMCILAMKSSTGPMPVHPDAIDVIVPRAEHHKCRFVWDPNEAEPSREANLVVDPAGKRYASIDLSEQTLGISFEFMAEANTAHTVHWGEEKVAPGAPWEETQMNWVPRLESLGFQGFVIPPGNERPAGASARIKLPFGTLSARAMVNDADTNSYVLWDFLGGPDNGGIRRALANEVVYTVDGIDTVIVTDAATTEIVRVSLGPFQTARMCVSNDMEMVPKDFTTDLTQLDHLRHLDVIAGGTFIVPKVVPPPRTGHKICDQVVYVYG